MTWGPTAGFSGVGKRAEEQWFSQPPRHRLSGLPRRALNLAGRAGLYNNLSPAGSFQNTRATFVPEKQTHQRLPVRQVNREVTAHQGAPDTPPGPAELIISTVTHTEERFHVRHLCFELYVRQPPQQCGKNSRRAGGGIFPFHRWVTGG